ncbi:polyisoprenoid-binding protein [Sandaracinomonas limnophila]|uniref:Polyisoprenoid-binding protein n=1 Tax=Sandaracinomonas limnophila TaxID=1862386 RepID=A0A437PW62_9BACT|nr:YceI family protein [Sandaracinomonas limnophila]RVU26497.1 polyisoprenoid-binding protein [Sandaracinomonas limnophila]
MKKIVIASALFLASSLVGFAQTFKVDKAHSKLGFSVVHLSISDVEGSFKITDATLTSSKDDFSDASFALTADVNTVNTDNERRDGHLKSADFFDAAKFPTISFKSKSFTKVADRKYKLVGDLTMHGVTKAITLDATLNGTTKNRDGKKVAGFKVTGSLNRTAFGVGSMPAAMVGEEIELKASGEFIQE